MPHDPTRPYWMSPSYRCSLLRDAWRCLRLMARPGDSGLGRLELLREAYRRVRQWWRNDIQIHHLTKRMALWEAFRDRPPRVVVEVGSYDGSDSAELSRMFPDAQVYAFEADPANYLKLVRTAAVRPHVRARPEAVFDFTGRGTFHPSRSVTGEETGRASGSLLAPTDDLMRAYPHLVFDTGVTVPTVSLADWAAQEGLDRIDLIWMDAQGAELHILRGAGVLLPTVRAVIAEVWVRNPYEDGGTFSELRDFLTVHGFVLTHTWMWDTTGDALFERPTPSSPGNS